MELSTQYWRKCSSCKKDIGYKAAHFVCSVSTCTRKRTGYVFCTVHCWERHLPGARHRDAAAIEAVSPTFEEWKRELSEAPPASSPATSSSQSTTSPTEMRSPQKVIVRSTSPSGMVNSPSTTSSQARPTVEKEILVVASKLKSYIRARSEMNTSDSVMDALSDQLRRLCDDAIDRARAAGRKTVMDRDFED